MKIEDRELWGLLWGPLIYLGATRHISNQLATGTETVEPEILPGRHRAGRGTRALLFRDQVSTVHRTM
jgi:hypothetical protein